MALFTDGTISAVDDLAGHDSGILDVASTEGIDLTKKLQLAQDELAVEISSLLGSSEALRNVVVTIPIRLWHAFRTLETVYRDAYSNQLNDRYGRKRDQYSALAQWAFQRIVEAGVPFAVNPVPKADAVELTVVPGQQAAATYYVSSSWVGTSGEEGAASEWRSISTMDGHIICVRAVKPPANAVSWNVFVGLSPDAMSQQNDAPLPIAEPWLQDNPVSTGGQTPGGGQTADQVRAVPRILQRG